MSNLPPGQAPVVAGPIDRVPCPHCGKPNDFRELQQQQLLDTKHLVDCDHCGMMMMVASIQQVTMIAVRKSNKRPRAGQQPAGQAQTISPAQAQRMLRGGR